MKERVSQALNLGRLSYGPLSQEFENRFAQMHGCKYGVLSNSGTSSLLVALQTLKELHGWQDGDEILAPSVTFVASINTIIQNRLAPVLIDIDEYLTIDCDLIEHHITPKTKGIMPVHLFGQPADMPRIMAIADKYNLKVVEDSCEAAFATIDKGSIDWWGDIGCHSFYMAHIITCGVGGIGITKNPDYANKMRSLANHALSYDYLTKSEAFDPMMLSRHFVFDSIGHSMRITELESALGLAQLDDWQSLVSKRVNNFCYLSNALQPLVDSGKIELLKTRGNATFCPMMFPITIIPETKYKIMNYLTSKGIGTRDALPLTNQPAYKNIFVESHYPRAQYINNHCFYVGIHQHLTTSDLDFIAQSMFDFYDNFDREG